MNTEKLLALADFLDTLPKRLKGTGNSFKMSSWKEEEPCGTRACAIGWAIELGHLKGMSFRYGEPAFQGEIGFKAIAYYFEITYCEANSLFSAKYHYMTELEVSKRIRRFVKENS